MNNRNVLITILEAGESRCLHGPVVQRALVSLVCSLCLLAESSHGQGGKLHLWDLCYNLMSSPNTYIVLGMVKYYRNNLMCRILVSTTICELVRGLRYVS